MKVCHLLNMVVKLAELELLISAITEYMILFC
jgi:hypothetical protein